MYFLVWLGLLFCAIGGVFCSFRYKQARGTQRLNDINADFGGGNFTELVTSGFRQLLWGILSISFAVGLGFALIFLIAYHSSETKKSKTVENHSQDTKKSATNQQQSIVEKILDKNDSTNTKSSQSSDAPLDHIKSEDQSQKTYTKEEVEQMEREKQYSGDDPIIRNRLGLPPKP